MDNSQLTVDLKQLFKKAGESADRYIKGIKDDQWENDTPCTDWNLRTLVNHLVNENLWVPELLSGKTVVEVGDALDGDLLGEDPKRSWEQSLQEANSAVADLKDLDQIVHVSWADITAGEYLGQLILDRLIHGWDVAKATGQETELDSELVEFVYEQNKSREKELKNSGAFGEHIEVEEDVPLQTKLLALLGRRA